MYEQKMMAKWTVWRSRLRLVILLIFAWPIAIVAADAAMRNLAYISLTKALVTDHIRAIDRQAKLEDFVKYLELVRDRKFSLPSIENPSEVSMLQATFIGEYYLAQRELDKAAGWYLQATQSDPLPIWQNSLLQSWQGNLMADGNVLVDDLSDVEGWVPDVNNNALNIAFASSDGKAFMSYQNHPNQRDFVAYSLYPNPSRFPLSYHTVLSIRVKLDRDAYLTLVTSIDGVRSRHLNYYQGTGDWETLRFPLTGDVLKEIKLSFSEPHGKPKVAHVYEVWVDWIKLELVDYEPY